MVILKQCVNMQYVFIGHHKTKVMSKCMYLYLKTQTVITMEQLLNSQNNITTSLGEHLLYVGPSCMHVSSATHPDRPWPRPRFYHPSYLICPLLHYFHACMYFSHPGEANHTGTQSSSGAGAFNAHFWCETGYIIHYNILSHFQIVIWNKSTRIVWLNCIDWVINNLERNSNTCSSVVILQEEAQAAAYSHGNQVWLRWEDLAVQRQCSPGRLLQDLGASFMCTMSTHCWINDQIQMESCCNKISGPSGPCSWSDTLSSSCVETVIVKGIHTVKRIIL